MQKPFDSAAATPSFLFSLHCVFCPNKLKLNALSTEVIERMYAAYKNDLSGKRVYDNVILGDKQSGGVDPSRLSRAFMQVFIQTPRECNLHDPLSSQCPNLVPRVSLSPLLGAGRERC